MALWVLSIACITLAIGFVLPRNAMAATCPLFENGVVRAKTIVAQGTSYRVGIKKRGPVLRLADSSTCARLDVVRIRNKNKGVRRIRVGNLWQEDGPDSSPEIVVTQRLGKTKLKVRIYTIATGGQIELLAKKTVTVAAGKKTLAIADKQLIIEGESYHLISLNDVTVLRPTEASVQFFTVGDQGLAGDDQDAVAMAMSTRASATNGIEFVGTLGDNFYPPNSISSTDDEDWETVFHAPYRLDGLDVPFYVSLGNHDYDDNDVTSILAYTDPGGTWNLPSEYYSFTYPASSTSPLVEYIVLDTYMIRNEWEGYEEQLAWLQSTLENSTARWKVVAGHHLVYSYGAHGGTSKIVEHVLPILKSAGADLYIAGHEHDKQYIDHPDDDIVYMVNGAASRLRDTVQGEYSEFAASTLGFTSYTVTNNKMSIEFYDTDAQREFRSVVTK